MSNATGFPMVSRPIALVRLAILFTMIASITPVKAQSPKHPLDALTGSEYWTAYEVLRASGNVDADARYPMVQLKEPPKEEVLAWKPGQPMRREAFVVVWKGKQTFEAVVDVEGKKLASWTEVKGYSPTTCEKRKMRSPKP